MTDSAEYVSRAGQKLAHALSVFRIDVAGKTCADFGSNIGGFVDVLLQRQAARVYSVDTGYGVLAWKLRKDPRVVVMERTNAMHVTLPEPIDLVTIDVAWTRQQHILPAAMRVLAAGGRIVSLIKPHYEADRGLLIEGVLPEQHLEPVVSQTLERIKALGLRVVSLTPSPIKGTQGNVEYLALLEPDNTAAITAVE